MQICQKGNSWLNAPLQVNNKPTLYLQHRYIQMHKQYSSSIKARQLIRERSKPSTDKTSEHDNSIYYGDNVKFYWINCITSLLFLGKQFYNRKLKFLIIISSLLHLTFACNVLSISFNSVGVRESQKIPHKRIFDNRSITYHLQN